MSGHLRSVARARRRRAKAAVGTAVLATSSLVGMGPSPVDAATRVYPQDPNNCNDANMQWLFQTNSLWTAGGVDRRTWVRAAINTLDNALDYDGSKLVTVTELNTNVDVQIKDKPMNEYGSSECVVGASFWVNSNYSTSRFYYQVGRHEMMHLAGGEHGGNDDSFNGDDPPTMATCIDDSTFRSTNALAQDDAAYLNWLHSSRDDRQLHANWGWEQGTSFWGRTGGTFDYKTSGGSLGPGYVGWLSPNSSNYVYQTVAVHTGDDNESYQAVTAAKSSSSDYKTVANPALYRRTISHNGDNSCSYADGVQNPNDYSVASGWIKVAEKGMTEVGTSWVGLESAWVNPANADGYEMQIRVYGAATHNVNGDAGYVHLDNTRGDGT